MYNWTNLGIELDPDYFEIAKERIKGENMEKKKSVIKDAKERFLTKFDNCIYDSEKCLVYEVNHRFIICDLLNQQDKRIKNLNKKTPNSKINWKMR